MMVALEFSKIAQWMMIALMTSGIVVGQELRTKCPLYKIHFCACSVDEPAKATPLKMCHNVSRGGNCEPCTKHFQRFVNCSKCPENKCPICSVDGFGPQQLHNKENHFSYMSRPKQTFFSFSTGLGNLLIVTPNSTYKMLPGMNHTSFFNPKYVENGSKYFGNHEISLISIPKNILDMLIKYFKYGLLKKQGIIFKNKIFIIDYNVPDSQPTILKFQRSVETDWWFNRDDDEEEPRVIKRAVEMPGEGISILPGQLHELTSINEYPASSKQRHSQNYRKLKTTLVGEKHPTQPKKIGVPGKNHTDFTKDIVLVPMKGNPFFGRQIKEADEAFHTVRGDSSFTASDNLNVTYYPVNKGYSLSGAPGNLSTTSSSPHDKASVKNSEVLNNTNIHEVGELSRKYFSDDVTVPFDVRNKTTFQLMMSENQMVKGNIPGNKSFDLRERKLESSLKPFSKDESPEIVSPNSQKVNDFRSYLLHLFYTTNVSHYATDHELSSIETPDYSVGEHQTADIIDGKVAYSLRIITLNLEDKLGNSNLPSTFGGLNNGNESLNFRPSNETESSLTNSSPVQDSSEDAIDQHLFGDKTSKNTEGYKTYPFCFFCMLFQFYEMKGVANLKSMSLQLYDKQMGKTNLPIISRVENYNQDRNFRKTNSTSNHLLFKAEQGSSGNVLDQHLLNDVTSEKAETTEGNDTKNTENPKIISPYLQAEQLGLSKLPMSSQRGNKGNESMIFNKPDDTESHSPRSLIERDTSDYTSHQHLFGSEISEYTEDNKGTIGKNNMNGIESLTIISSDISDQQQRKSNLPTIIEGENYGNTGVNFRIPDYSASHYKVLFAENATKQHFLDDVSPKYKGEEKETTETIDYDKSHNLTIVSSPYIEEHPGQSNLTIVYRAEDDYRKLANLRMDKDSERHLPDLLAGRNSSRYATKHLLFGYETFEILDEGIQPMVTNDKEHINKLVGVSSHLPNAQLDSTSRLPIFDIKRGNINHTSLENKQEISPIETRASPEVESNHSSSHLRHSNVNYTGDDFSSEKYRIGRKLLRFAEIDRKKPVVTHFSISKFGRKRRLAKDDPYNSWCIINEKVLYGNVECSFWSYQKVCVIKCNENHYIHGDPEATFKCYRRKNVWEPKLMPCEEDLQRKHESQTIQKNKVQEHDLQSESKIKPKEAEGSKEEQAPINKYGDANDIESNLDGFGEYEYAIEKSDEEKIGNYGKDEEK